jgi:hydroxymethylpyrimidine/phosphomethylpyrimidine kinase
MTDVPVLVTEAMTDAPVLVTEAMIDAPVLVTEAMIDAVLLAIDPVKTVAAQRVGLQKKVGAVAVLDQRLNQLKEKVVWLPVVLQQNQQRVNPQCVKHVLAQVALLLHVHRVHHEQSRAKLNKSG